MIKILKDTWKSKTFADLNISFLELILSRGINLVLFLLVARTLGPEGYGVYSLVTVSIVFFVAFFDIGAENVAVRFSGKYQHEREKIFGIYLLWKTIITIILIAVFVLFPELLTKLLNKPEAQKYLYLILIGFVIDSFRSLLDSYYQSLERFFIKALISIGTFSIRLTTIYVLLRLSINDIQTITLFFAFSSVPVVLIFSHNYISFFKNLIGSRMDRVLLKEIIIYGKWSVLASLPIKLMTRLDFYMITRFSSYEEIGIYNSAVQLLSFFSYIPLCIGTVLLPKVSSYNDFSRIKSFVRKSIVVGIAVTILIIITIPFSDYLIYFVLGAKYVSTVYFFKVLLIAFVFTLWTVLLGNVFYALGNIQYLTLGAYIQLILFTGSASIFVSHYGINAVLWSKVFANLAYLLLVVYVLIFDIYPSYSKSN